MDSDEDEEIDDDAKVCRDERKNISNYELNDS